MLYDSAVHSASPSSLMLRFAPIHLRWRSLLPSSDRCTEADVDALLSSPMRVVHLDASAWTSISAALWGRVLRSECALQVRDLTMNKGPYRWPQPVSARVWPLLGRLNLRSLSFGALPRSPSTPLTPPAFPNLTSLHFDAFTPGSLLLFARCPIRHATLIRPSGTDLQAFLRSPSVSGLQSLRLESAQISDGPPFLRSPSLSDLQSLRLESAQISDGPQSSAICALRSLRTLHLYRVRLIRDVARDLMLQSALKHITIEPGRPASHRDFRPSLPSMRSICDPLSLDDPTLPMFTFRMLAQRDGTLSEGCNLLALACHIKIEAVRPGVSKGPGRDCGNSMRHAPRRP